VAEIRGRDKPQEVVLLGAHLDSWDLGTGEEDNGVNAAMVIDVARGVKQLGLAPRRSIRFVLFTGEEQGMWGSAGYVQRHTAEMDHHVAVVIFDTGSGRTTGFYLNGRGELRNTSNEARRAVAGLGTSEQVIDALDGTDNFAFILSGVPNVVADQDPIPYLPTTTQNRTSMSALTPTRPRPTRLSLLRSGGSWRTAPNEWPYAGAFRGRKPPQGNQARPTDESLRAVG